MQTKFVRRLLASTLAVALGIGLIRAADPPKPAEPDPQKLLSEPKALPFPVFPGMADNKNMLEMQRTLEKAIQSGDPDELNDALQQMQKLLLQDLQQNGLPNLQLFPMQGDMPRMQIFPLGQGGFGGFGGFGEAPLVEDNQAEQLRKTMNETIKNFDKSIDEAQDEETKKSLRAARDNYKKATEEEIEKLAQNEPQRPAQPQMQPFNFAPVPMNGADPFGLFAPNLTQQKPRLGVMLLPVPEGMAGQLKLKADQGVVVNRVLPGSVAEKAGLERFDIILEFAGKPVAGNVQAFVDSVNMAKAGDDLEIVVLRNGERKTLKGIVLAKAERAAAQPQPLKLFPVPRMMIPLEMGALPGDNVVKNPGAMKMTIVKDTFKMNVTQNDIKYAIEGKIDGVNKELTAITITDGSKTIKAESLEKVPAEYRKTVEQFLGKLRPTRASLKKNKI